MWRSLNHGLHHLPAIVFQGHRAVEVSGRNASSTIVVCKGVKKGVALRRGHEVMRDFEECQCMQARQESDETRPNCQLGRGEGGYDICGTRANEIPRHTLLA